MSKTDFRDEQTTVVCIVGTNGSPPKVLHIKATKEQVINQLQPLIREEQEASASLPLEAELSTSDNLLIRSDSTSFKRVAIGNIAYLEAERSYCRIHLKDGRNILLTVSMSEVQKKLPKSRFIRIHSGYIVNLTQVDGLIGNTLVMEDGKQLTISRTYRSRVFQNFTFIGTTSRKYITENGNPSE